jgi:hypothetical protein
VPVLAEAVLDVLADLVLRLSANGRLTCRGSTLPPGIHPPEGSL